MINYEYLEYWLKTITNINLLEKLLTDNITGYLGTQDTEYLEFINETIKEIKRLIPLKEEYYEKAFPNN